MASSLVTALPTELLDHVVYYVAAQQPLGPPYAVLRFILTCRQIYDAVSPRANPVLWKKIFRLKFDCAAVKRRMFQPSSEQYVDQLARYCRALQVLRNCDPVHGATQTQVDDQFSLEDALMTAVVMMFEDDGKNARQLCEWAQAHRILKNLIRYSLYREMKVDNGWPSENQRNACALQLSWMLTSEESIANETTEEREHISAVLMPFVLVPYRYPSAAAPPQHFRLPFPPTLSSTPQCIPTAHGSYPKWPSADREIAIDYYGTRLRLQVPLVAPAATQLLVARHECTPLNIPEHLPPERHGEVHELNWGWAARPPQGLRVGPPPLLSSPSAHMDSSWSWGVGDYPNPFSNSSYVTTPVDEGDTTINAARGIEMNGSSSSSSRGSYSSGQSSASASGPIVVAQPWNHTRKASHKRYQFPTQGVNTRSRRWDPDWWRMRLCGNPWVPRLKVGRVFEPGSLDGLWQGRFMLLDEENLRKAISNPTFPGVLRFRKEMRFILHPLYIRLREAHRVVPRATSSCAVAGPSNSFSRHLPAQSSPAPVPTDLGGADRANDENIVGGAEWFDNMSNSWFAGSPGSTSFAVRPALERECRRERGSSGSNLQHEGNGVVVELDAMGRKAVFPCWQRRKHESGTDHDDGDKSSLWRGYEHDQDKCESCQTNARFRRPSEQDESIFASVGLGLSERKTLEEAECDGVQEIYVVGKSMERHCVWGNYDFYGRVRPWDGLVGVLRRPASEGRGYQFFYGYIVGGETWVGHWRFSGTEGDALGLESAFVMSKRDDLGYLD